MSIRRPLLQRSDGRKAGWLKPAGLFLCGLLLFSTVSAGAAELLQHGRFERITLYHPEGAPRSVAIFLSGDAGWNDEMAALARNLAAHGALVAGVSTPAFLKQLSDDGDCAYADGDLENLSHFVQAYARLPGYRLPVLVGQSAGATLAYATLAQSQGLFAAALSLDFKPQLALGIPLCDLEKQVDASGTKGRKARTSYRPAPHLPAPWIAIQGERDHVFNAAAAQQFAKGLENASVVILPADKHGRVSVQDREAEFSNAYLRLTAQQQPVLPPPGSLSDLPLIELPLAAGSSQAASDRYAVLLSGDGGWAGLDKEVAAALRAKGVPVVGFDSLRYFWTARTPQKLAADLDRVLRYYADHWKKRRVLLVGYSQGADVLPFALNRLPPPTASQIALTTLMGVGENAVFEFHVSNWVSDGGDGLPILPELQRLAGGKVLCLYGEDETADSLCPRLDPRRFIVVKMAGGHHFDGNYDTLATHILQTAGQR